MYIPILRISKPDIATSNSPDNHQALPDPDREEYQPVTPCYGVIQAQGEQEGEHQQAREYNKLTENTNTCME